MRALGLPLYLRLWLGVVLAVALLTSLVAVAWRYSAEPPLRDAVLFDADGQTVIGRGHSLPRGPGRGGNATARGAASEAPEENRSSGGEQRPPPARHRTPHRAQSPRQPIGAPGPHSCFR